MTHREKETQSGDEASAKAPKHQHNIVSEVHEKLAAHAAQRDAIRTASSRVGPLRFAYRGSKA